MSLAGSLRAALIDAGSPWTDAPLEFLPDSGLAHAHLRLVGTGALARIPKQSQMDLPAAANLGYQATCFERASASGHAPRLHGVLPPSAALPRGALLVEEIVGAPAGLPQDLPAIAEALAAIHSLPLPETAMRSPLLDAADPLADLRDQIEAQAVHLEAADLAPTSRHAIDARRAALAALCAQPDRPPRRLIAFDAHPGNFIVRADGRAMLVDLEKARYSLPPLDLAHATLYTSTTWDVASSAVLSVAEVQDFLSRWQSLCHGSEAWRGWLLPLRSAMWLWSVTWCAKWRVLSSRAAKSAGDGEDWSGENSEVALIAHVRGRVDHYLSPDGVARVMAELDALAALAT